MRKLIITALALVLAFSAAQAQLTTTPSGGNKLATVSERIGLTDVTIHYSRPGVKGREGKIWGQLVYPGFANLGFGTAAAAPWRAGANENTTFTFSTNVWINGQPLAAGTYGFFIAYGPEQSTAIFSKNATSWGSFYYNEAEDALRVKLKPIVLDKSVERLRYEFEDQTDSSATIALEWEKLRLPISVTVDVTAEQLASFRNELRSSKGFTWMGWNQAAQWCLQNKVNYEEALKWADSASGPLFGGNNQFQTLATKAQLLAALNRNEESAAVMKTAMPLASVTELHQYGRQLIGEKKPQEALAVFKMNAARNPKQFTTYVGLARGYSAVGDYKSALKYAQLALPLAPESLNKGNVEMMIQKLSAGKDIN